MYDSANSRDQNNRHTIATEKFKLIIDKALSSRLPNMVEQLRATEPQTGHTYRQVLTQGRESVKMQRIAVVTTAGNTLTPEQLSGSFAIGDILSFRLRVAIPDGDRAFEGEAPGILLNGHHEQATPPPTWTGLPEPLPPFDIPSDCSQEALVALIRAEVVIETVKPRNKELTELLLSPTDINRALGWLLSVFPTDSQASRN